MQEQNSNFHNKENLVEDIKKYINLKIEHLQLSFVEKVSLLVGKMVLLGAIGLFVLSLILLLMILIYNLLITWIGIGWVVTLIEMGIVGILMLILWYFRDKLIIRPIAHMIIQVIYDQPDEKTSPKQDSELYE